MTDKLRDQHTTRNFLKGKIDGTITSGAVQPEDLQTAAYMYFHTCLGHQHQTICKLLESIVSADNEQSQVLADLDDQGKLSTDMAEIKKEMLLQTKAIRHEESKDIFAGTLFVLLNSLVRSMASRIKQLGGKEHQVAAGKTIGSTSLFELMRAAGNNFRHHEEWTDPTKNNQNFQVLSAAGLKAPWDKNYCYDAFKLIGWDTVDDLERDIKKMASEIFQFQTGIPL